MQPSSITPSRPAASEFIPPKVASSVQMDTSENRPHVVISHRGLPYTALIDTGAVKSYIGDRIADRCHTDGVELLRSPVSLAKMANGDLINIPGAYVIDFTLGDNQFTEEFAYLPRLTTDVVLGMDFLGKRCFTLNLGNHALYLDGRLLLPTPTIETVSPIGGLSEALPLVLTAIEENRLKEFLAAEIPKFTELKGTTPLIQHEIRLLSTEPIKQRYRPQNPRMQEIIDSEVDRMLKEEIIEPSNSPWSSPVVIVRKKDGNPRFCVDFQKINAISRKDAYPLPFINAILDKLRSAKYISSIDLRQGYWQVPLTADSKPITAFTVPGRGLFHFNVMPFGLHAAPATFQRLMDRVIGPELDPYCFAYLDDIIVLGKTLEEHLLLLQEVFRRLRQANLKINPDKCQFGRRTLTYLGHVVTPTGIQTDPEKVTAILHLPTPKNVRTLRQFLGIASWYRRFVPDFAKIAAPLHKLLKKQQKWWWTGEQDGAFERIKEMLTRAPVLTCPDFSKPFTLQTDASAEGVGAALLQFTDGGDQVIAYASRTLTATERKYSVTEKECLAIVWGIEKMRPYLEGYHFTVVTDHQSLKWLTALKNPSGRLARWCMYLQQFDFEVKYRRGVLNKVADALSRNPLPISTELEDEILALEDLPECTWYSGKKTEVERHPDRFPDYCIRNDTLYRRFWDNGPPKEGLSDPWKLCVQKHHRFEILKENHDMPTAGHLGTAKTTARIAERYYWPGMFRDIAVYVRKCASCQQYKLSQQKPPGLMQSSPNTAPWETVSTDIVGPLPRSNRGNNYLLVFQDRFTKWVQCRAIRKATAKVISTAFYDDIVMRFGCPKTVITDNGTQYTGKTFTDLLNNLGIHHRRTPPYTPQANPVERTNKTLKTMIAQFCEGEHKRWDHYLPDLNFAINTARHDSTGYSPAFLNFGRELMGPKSLYHRFTIPKKAPGEPSSADRITHSQRFTKLQDIFELVHINLSHAFSVQQHHYNLRRRPWQCHLGDQVLKRDNPLSSAAKGFAAKLAPKYTGPYTVIKVVSPTVYHLKDGQGKRYLRTHIKDLKPYN